MVRPTKWYINFHSSFWRRRQLDTWAASVDWCAEKSWRRRFLDAGHFEAWPSWWYRKTEALWNISKMYYFKYRHLIYLFHQLRPHPAEFSPRHLMIRPPCCQSVNYVGYIAEYVLWETMVVNLLWRYFVNIIMLIRGRNISITHRYFAKMPPNQSADFMWNDSYLR